MEGGTSAVAKLEKGGTTRTSITVPKGQKKAIETIRQNHLFGPSRDLSRSIKPSMSPETFNTAKTSQKHRENPSAPDRSPTSSSRNGDI